MHYVRSFHVAKFGSFYLNTSVPLASGIDNFLSDMLSLSVTIRPDDQKTGVLGLIGDVIGYGFLVLQHVVSDRKAARQWMYRGILSSLTS